MPPVRGVRLLGNPNQDYGKNKLRSPEIVAVGDRTQSRDLAPKILVGIAGKAFGEIAVDRFGDPIGSGLAPAIGGQLFLVVWIAQKAKL